MSDGVETLSIEETARLLSRLRQADHLRLAALAQAWISGCPRREAAALFNEALVAPEIVQRTVKQKLIESGSTAARGP